jgi:hypothetical protein
MLVGNLFVLITLVSNFWVQAPNIGHHGLKSKSMYFDKKWAKPDEKLQKTAAKVKKLPKTKNKVFFKWRITNNEQYK